MFPKSLHFITAVLLGTFLLADRGWAQAPDTVKTATDLARIANAKGTNPAPGNHFVYFNFYGSPGQFKLDTPSGTIESITFQRLSQDSVGVLRPTDNLPIFDIKGMKGTLILKGLAFHLPNEKSRLIAGAEAGKENGTLVLDNCTIYGDTLDGPFLGWVAGTGKIEIRNSYFVTPGGKPTARMNLTAPEIALSNNLFNFPGGIDASVSSRLDVTSNNLNRTQFNIRTQNFGVPTFHFTRNYIAHPPKTNAFGTGEPWVLYHSGFDLGISTVLLNKRYKQWAGFDYDSSSKWSATPGSNSPIDSVEGKPSSEQWNWYMDSPDETAGMLTGVLKQARYNVLPGTRTFSWKTGFGDLSVQFRTALFPRMIRLDTTERIPALADSSLRPVHTQGVLQFGPFEIESILIGAEAQHGKPVLLANDAAGKFAAQTGGSDIDSDPSVFGNTTATARRFILAERCNTPRGALVSPGAGSFLDPNEKLVFEKVEMPGRTVVLVDQEEHAFLKDYRKLGNIYFRTSAEVRGTVDFGIPAPETAAYWPDREKWHVISDTSIQRPAVGRPTTGADAGKFTGTATYTSAKGFPFSAFLVEELTVPRGGKVFETSEGSVLADSTAGYQLKVDSAQLDPMAEFAVGTKGYRFTWAGRASGDSLFLILKSKPRMSPYVKVGTAAPQLLDKIKETEGEFRIPIAMDDNAKAFFLGMKYDIIADREYKKADGAIFDSVTIDKFVSSTSGKLDFAPITREMVSNRLGDFGDAVRFRAGIKMLSTDLTVKAGWIAEFSSPAFIDTSKVDAYYYDGKEWKALEGNYVSLSPPRFQVRAIPASATEIILLETLPPVSESVKTFYPPNADMLVVYTQYTDTVNRAITHFCVEVKSIGESGKVEIESCEEHTFPIASDTVSIPLSPNRAYSYKVEYLKGNEPYTNASFRAIAGRSWDKSLAVPDSAKVKEKFHWHLVGFPIKTSWKTVMDEQPISDAKAIDTLKVRKIDLVDGKDAFVEVTDLESPIMPGTAFLFASSREYHLQMDMKAEFLALEPYSVKVKKGWNLIANPFPFAFPLSRFSIEDPADRFLKLKRIDTSVYVWEKISELEKFTGYAYYSDGEDHLVFDPLAPEQVSSLAKSAAGGIPSQRISARLQTRWGSSIAILNAKKGAIDIPFLPVPGSSPQLRLGSGRLMVKAIPDGAAIDEIVEINSPQTGNGSFLLEANGGRFEAVSLIHLASGKVFDGSAMENLPLSAGSQSFRLLAGDRAFVMSATETFLAGAPGDITLSQNYPNPFRGKTQVALDWPAWDGGPRRAVLEVVDMQGRSVERMDLGPIRMGRQIVTVDGSGWRPGLYLYRLTVATGGKKAHLQKRMLVSP